MSLIRSSYRSNNYAQFIGDHVNNGTASVALVKFCKTLVNSLGIERLNETSLKVSVPGVYEFTFPLSIKASLGINYYIGVGVNGEYDEFSSGATPATIFGDTYRYIFQLEAGDIITIRVRLGSTSTNFTTNSSVLPQGASTSNTVIPTGTLKKI